MRDDIRIALTGFMGVGKSSVARHLANLLPGRRIDLDHFIEDSTHRRIPEIIESDGLDGYRSVETVHLRRALETGKCQILSLGGGAWTLPENRSLIRSHGFRCIWLEATFDHCWRNIKASRKDRPLAKDKQTAMQLFNERQKEYCLAEWHLVVRPGTTSYDIAVQIVEQVVG